MVGESDREKRRSIIERGLRVNELGINQGTSGNISLRHDNSMPVTPSSVPDETMQPEQIDAGQADIEYPR
jgi:L-fuculose-phosphate aldolase